MGIFFKNLFGGKASGKAASDKTPKVNTPIFSHEEPVLFEIKLSGIDRGDLIRFMGPASVFYGALASGARDPEDFCYFYGDHSVQFFFYIYKKGSTRIFKGVAAHLNGGIEPWPFTGEDRVRVRANLEWLLQYKALLRDKDILPENQPDKVIFEYDL